MKRYPVISLRESPSRRKRGCHRNPGMGEAMLGIFLVCMTLNYMVQYATSYHIANGDHGYARPERKTRPMTVEHEEPLQVAAVQNYKPSSPEWWGLETCGRSQACLERFNKAERRRK